MSSVIAKISPTALFVPNEERNPLRAAVQRAARICRATL